MAWRRKIRDIGNATELSFEDFELGPEGTAALADVLPSCGVLSLDLSSAGPQDEGVVALARVLPETRLTSLNLSRTSCVPVICLSLSELTLLFACPCVRARTVSHMRDAGALALAAVLPRTQLRTLIITRAMMHAESMHALALGLAATRLSNFSFSDTRLANQLALLVPAFSQMPLTTLDLQSAHLVLGIDSLTSVLPDTQVTDLNLQNNKFGPAGARSLASVLSRTRLTLLNLTDCGLNSTGFRALANGLAGSVLASLNLKNNGGADDGVNALAVALPHSRLTSLDLSLNRIKIAGVRALADVLAETRLTTLVLYGNDMRAPAARILAPVLPSTRLTSFHVSFGDAGDSLLASVLPDTSLVDCCMFPSLLFVLRAARCPLTLTCLGVHDLSGLAAV